VPGVEEKKNKRGREGCDRRRCVTPGPSSAPLKGCGGGSARSMAAWILIDASRDILPHMKRSFDEQWYTPSTGMDQSEWEIILEHLIIMGLIIKEEVVSETDD
jgi:hypothetical protein